MLLKCTDFYGQQSSVIVCDTCEQRAGSRLDEWHIEAEEKRPLKHFCPQCQTLRCEGAKQSE